MLEPKVHLTHPLCGRAVVEVGREDVGCVEHPEGLDPSLLAYTQQWREVVAAGIVMELVTEVSWVVDT